ncbi:hypothetical protein U9M48_005303 [Paspalum notatum var. saurae]|uniref:Protein FAR1-RELATED SEQUENCE n=1 Tax=Paspalum notatum var. saurae TaxID=547442 RepID=A0AAQ3PXA5_PASNO
MSGRGAEWMGETMSHTASGTGDAAEAVEVPSFAVRGSEAPEEDAAGVVPVAAMAASYGKGKDAARSCGKAPVEAPMEADLADTASRTRPMPADASLPPPMQMFQVHEDCRSAFASYCSKVLGMQMGPCSVLQVEGMLNNHGNCTGMDTRCSFQELIYGFTCGSLVARGVEEGLGSVQRDADQGAQASLEEKEDSSDESGFHGSKLDDGYVQSAEDDTESVQFKDGSEDSEAFTEDEHTGNVPQETGNGAAENEDAGTRTELATSRPLEQGWKKKGFDKRAICKTKCCKCPAMIRLHRTEDDGWFISSFVKEHNHELSATDAEKREWNSHRKIDQGTRDFIKYLRENNITLSKVHIIMGSLFGGMDNIPFTRRSLRTVCSQIATEQRADDIKKTLEIFRKFRSKDLGFTFSVDMDEDGQIKTLIWINGRSRINYRCFGDVVTFDTTYTTNLYKMPFGLFVGVNNHFQTTFFGGVLMRDETAESFAWVFSEFVELMGGVEPKTILTVRGHGDCNKKTMEGTNHLWCRWHVFKDARLELGSIYRKNSPFRDEFHKVITEMYTIDEFEAAWKDLLEKYGLEKHHFLVKAHDKRHRWAKAYNKGKFCARMMSTQRSKSANNMLKAMVPRNSSMNRFVDNLSSLLHIRDTEAVSAEHETKHTVRVKKRCWPVEKHALDIYTSNVYDLFSKEIDKSHSYHVFSTDDCSVFRVKHNHAEFVERFRRPEFEVRSINNGQAFECECGMYEHFGMLCCHVLRKIPPSHIMQRWTKKAYDMVPMELRMSCRSTPTGTSKVIGQTRLFGSSAYMSDEDVMRIKAPPIPARKGRPKTNRYLSLYDVTNKKSKKVVNANVTVKKLKQVIKSGHMRKPRKQSVATKITPHCSRCKVAGPDKRRCPEPIMS